MGSSGGLHEARDHGAGIAAVVLAAGAGTRFGGELHKLRADVDGVPLVRRAVDAARSSGIGPVMVVTGSEPLGDLLPPGVSEIRATDWSAGQSHSLQAAVVALQDTHVGAMVVGLADMPWVGPEAWRTVAGVAGPVVVATFDGHRRPPVKLHRSVWAELPTSGDEGARELMRRRPDLVVEAAVIGAHAGHGADVDEPGDLRSSW